MKSLKDDWQYIVPFLILVIFFIGTDLIAFINKLDFAYFSGVLYLQPYRAVSTHFIHADFNHLIFNSCGIAVARYFFKQLRLESSYFFLVLISLLMPLQIFLQWFVDVYLFRNQSYLLMGFSGILYGVYAFIMLCSIYGKQRFLIFDIGALRSDEVREAILLVTGIGFVGSFLPKISFSAHLTGFFAGTILYFL